MFGDVKKIAIGLLLGVVLVMFPYSNTLGQLKARELKNQLLTNLACSLPEAEFTQVLNNLNTPQELKDVAGDKSDAVWIKLKEQLVSECFNG